MGGGLAPAPDHTILPLSAVLKIKSLLPTLVTGARIWPCLVLLPDPAFHTCFCPHLRFLFSSRLQALVPSPPLLQILFFLTVSPSLKRYLPQGRCPDLLSASSHCAVSVPLSRDPKSVQTLLFISLLSSGSQWETEAKEATLPPGDSW